MTGKTHKAIGVAVGTAMTLYAVGIGEPMLAMGMITAPLGAMLPDIDHDRSKLGSQRKVVTNTVTNVVKVVSVCALIGFIIIGYLQGTLIESALKAVIVVTPVAVCSIIASTPKVKDTLKFYTKHRGIMHTLLSPAGILFGGYTVGVPIVKTMLLGLALGYLSHLMADCCTKAGCPIFWPLTTKCISILKITTGTFFEYVAGALLSGGIIWMGIFLGR